MAASEALGNGCHIHYSVWRGDENLFAAGEPPFGLSREGRGRRRRRARPPARDAAPIFAPSVSSYLRLQPQHWSGAYTTWGVDNREAALRLSRGMWTRRAGAAPTSSSSQPTARPTRTWRRRSSSPPRWTASIAGRACPRRSRKTRPRSPKSSGRRPGHGGCPPIWARRSRRSPRSQFAKETLGEEEHAAFVATRRNEWETFRATSAPSSSQFHELRYG